MSKHEVLVYEASISPHPNADAIELCNIGDYQSIVRKSDFKNGDLVAYIPEQSVVPLPVIEELGLVGKLSGSAKNRVKAIKLRGVLSQGLIYRAKQEWKLGEDVAEFLGITKWEPVIPEHLKGRIKGVAHSITVSYDVENIKKWNRHFSDGEIVAITEKIHGTNVQIGIYVTDEPNPILHEGKFWVSSKGLGGSGFVLDFEDETNSYVKIAKSPEYQLLAKLEYFRKHNLEVLEGWTGLKNPPVVFMGEIFGPGIQKGFPYGDKVQFRLFDIALGDRSNRVYLNWDQFIQCSLAMDVPTAPTLYIGPYSKEVVLEHTSGYETVSGKKMHIREGCVVKPIEERQSGNLGRVILKSISEAYLTRKGGEEDLTEFQ